MKPQPFLYGRLVYLRGIEREDLKGPMLYWNDDHEVTRYLMRGAYPSTLMQLEHAYEALQNSKTDIELAVISKENHKHIGVTGLHALNGITHSAEFRVLIGEKAYWGKGYGTEVVQLMLVYAFELLNLHKVWLGVNSANIAALKSYQKAGFVQEGELRNEVYRNGRYYNAIRMSMLRNEYEELKSTWNIFPEIREQFPR